MGITRRTFIKGLGSGITALGLSDVIFTRSGWAGAVHPAKTKDTQVTTSICPFCGVGCGLVANTKGGKLINVEGDPDHPTNRGALDPKSLAIRQMSTSPLRLKTVMYRAPGSNEWEVRTWEWATEQIANRIKHTRDSTFVSTVKVDEADVAVNRTEGIAWLGGAANNSEDCYVASKFCRALGLVYLEHQARI